MIGDGGGEGGNLDRSTSLDSLSQTNPPDSHHSYDLCFSTISDPIHHLAPLLTYYTIYTLLSYPLHGISNGTTTPIDSKREGEQGKEKETSHCYQSDGLRNTFLQSFLFNNLRLHAWQSLVTIHREDPFFLAYHLPSTNQRTDIQPPIRYPPASTTSDTDEVQAPCDHGLNTTDHRCRTSSVAL